MKLRPGWFRAVTGLGILVLGGAAGCFVPNPSRLSGEESSGDFDQTGSSGRSPTGTTADRIGTTSSSGTSGDEVPDDCAQGFACNGSAAPPAWEGPALVALSTPESESSCPPGSEVGFQLTSEFSANPAVCECSCGPVEEVVCDGRMRVHVDNECPPLGTTNGGIGDTCAPFPPAFDPTHHWSLETWVDTGGCEPTTETMLPKATVATRIDICIADPGGGTCETGICLPEVGGEARHCIWAVGDLACPKDTEFSEKLLGNSGYDDTRGCLDCACASPDAACRATAELFSSTDCAGGTQSEVIAWDGAGSCVLAIEEVSSVRVVFDPDPQATCAPSAPQPVGGLVPLEQTTLCCSPD